MAAISILYYGFRRYYVIFSLQTTIRKGEEIASSRLGRIGILAKRTLPELKLLLIKQP